MHVQKQVIFTIGMLFKINENHLMGYNLFVSETGGNYLSKGCRKISLLSTSNHTHFECIHVHKTQDHKLKKKKKEGKKTNQPRYRWKRRIWV